jgi:hypothetical protein
MTGIMPFVLQSTENSVRSKSGQKSGFSEEEPCRCKKNEPLSEDKNAADKSKLRKKCPILISSTPNNFER